MKNFAGWTLAAALTALPTLTFAEDIRAANSGPSDSKAVTLSDAELDKVHAGAASTILFLENRGNASVSTVVPDRHLGCINGCFAPADKGATGLLFVFPASGNVIVHSLGR